jgi:transcriptional regulator with XRE-family HTH domain
VTRHDPTWRHPYQLEVGRRLTAVREARGLSRRALAAQSGMNASQLALIEWGGHAPRPVTLRPLAAALGLEHTALVAILAGVARDPLGASEPASPPPG